VNLGSVLEVQDVTVRSGGLTALENVMAGATSRASA
jgi:hypothetical protein